MLCIICKNTHEQAPNGSRRAPGGPLSDDKAVCDLTDPMAIMGGGVAFQGRCL